MKMLARCAGSSLAGVLLEFVLLTMLVSALHLHYVAAALCAGIGGFAVSFALNRFWAFDGRGGCPRRQLLRHAVVVAGGIVLGTLVMWLGVAALRLPYQIGWLGGGALVFLSWTYPMQRFFTYAPAIVPSV